MANMGYCRFQNTLNDLEECFDSMENDEELSESEEKAKEKLIQLCIEIGNIFGERTV
jgi:hypothetical protein